MTKQKWILSTVLFVLAGAATFFGYRKWGSAGGPSRDEMLALLPADANAVVFVDFAELRSATFLAQLYEWASKPQTEADYAQFVKDTGFDFERDLDRAAMAIEDRGQDSSVFAILDGKFDRRKISAFALKNGSAATTGAREIFSAPVAGSPKKISFAFLTNSRIALTNDSNLNAFLEAKTRHEEDFAEWRARFERLAGSPLFAVIRQDSELGTSLAAQAPGGLRSPQLSTLLNQLQWVTIAGKPENDRLRVVAEGECTADAAARQLTDMLNGVVILAEAGLNDPKTRQQLDPATREAYLDLLKNADIAKLDRGETKSVRLVLEITSAFLEATRKAQRFPESAPPAKRRPEKSATRKGHT